MSKPILMTLFASAAVAGCASAQSVALGQAAAEIHLRCEQRPYAVTFEAQRALVTEPNGERVVLSRLPGKPGIDGPMTYSDGHLTLMRDRIDPDRSPIAFERDKVA